MQDLTQTQNAAPDAAAVKSAAAWNEKQRKAEGINEFASMMTTLTDRAERQHDYIAPDSLIRATRDGKVELVTGRATYSNLRGERYSLSSNAFSQIATKLGIPIRYARKMMEEHPELWATNINTWLGEAKSSRLIRTEGTEIRAFLSDTYRPIDNLDFMAAVAQAAGAKKAWIRSSMLSPTKLIIKASAPGMVAEITPEMIDTTRDHGGRTHWLKEPMPVRGFVTFSNSEVGCGGLQIDGGIEVLHCTNDYRSTKPLFRRVHIGGKSLAGNDVRQFIRTETQQLRDRALWNEIRDVAMGVFDRSNMQSFIDNFTGAMGRPISLAADKAVESVVERFALAESERDNILNSFIATGDLTQFGMAQAITASALKVEDVDRRFGLEKTGTEVIELGPRQWAAVA